MAPACGWAQLGACPPCCHPVSQGSAGTRQTHLVPKLIHPCVTLQCSDLLSPSDHFEILIVLLPQLSTAQIIPRYLVFLLVQGLDKPCLCCPSSFNSPVCLWIALDRGKPFENKIGFSHCKLCGQLHPPVQQSGGMLDLCHTLRRSQH